LSTWNKRLKNTNYFVHYAQKDIVYTMYNSFGQRVFTKGLTSNSGLNQLSIDVAQMPNGVYLLEIKDSEDREIQKISVQH
jgi:hypothetical protein